MRRGVLAFVLTALAAAPAASQRSGVPVVLGSDAIALDGEVFLLDGVDGIELHQFCFVNGRPWGCGAAATRALQTLLDQEPVTCAPTGATTAAGAFATCTMRLGDVAEIMVRQGWALAYGPQSERYAAAEAEARGAQAGVWRGALVEPWVYRQDIAAIEARYAERAADAILAGAEAAVGGERGGLAIFAGFDLCASLNLRAACATAGGAPADQEVRVAAMAAGFILDAIGGRDIFAWPTVARTLQTWRDAVVAAVAEAVVNSVWADLALRPPTDIDIQDVALFYAALREQSAAWLAAGRQPVLLVAASDNPTWIGGWFDDKAPQGALVTRKDAIDHPGYLGTIDGVDVYVGVGVLGGAAQATEAYLFPDDLLVRILYRPGETGAVLAMARDAAPEPDELVFRYARSVEWRGDVAVRITYPYEIAVPYGS